MKNLLKHLINLQSLLLLAMTGFFFSSCSDDDDNGGVPEITGVRVCDPEKADSLFTKSSPGATIVIIGKNLGHARHVYINDQEVSFNSTFNTDHSIIVTIPTEEKGFKLSSFDSSISDEIKVETNGGVASYAFKITAPFPTISRLEGSYPRDAGDTILLYGQNLVDIENAYIIDELLAPTDTSMTIGGNKTEITDYFDISQNHHLNENNLYVTTSVVGAVVPANAPDSGTFVLECTAGTAYISFYKLPGKPVITSCSNDMPEIGEDLIITGRDFVQVEKVTYGDVTLTSNDFTVSATQDTITIPFTNKPSSGSASTLTVTTVGGSATIDRFYDRTTLLTTFDGDATDNGWGPNCQFVDGGNADGMYAYIHVTDYGNNGWGTMVFFRKDWSGNSFTLSSNIPSSVSASKVYLAYNVYDNYSDINADDYGCGAYLRTSIFPIGDTEYDYDYGFAWKSYPDTWIFEQTPLADINGNAHKGRWYRVVVSLNNYSCFKGLTYADIVKQGINQFRLMDINQTNKGGNIDLKIDNVRIIYIP
jgi:hypothetical protein